MSELKTKCRGCNHLMTWASQRQQFGRLSKKGWNKEQIKAIMPRCQKCVTIHLRTDKEQEQAKTGLAAIIGKWPGDESDEEINRALEELS